MRVSAEVAITGLSHSFLLFFFSGSDKLVLVKGEVLYPIRLLIAETNMNTSLMILHLLFRLKSLLAFNNGALKFVIILDGYVVSMDFNS